MRSFASNHPIIFVISLTIAWLVLLMILMGIASSALRTPYGDVTTTSIGHLAVTACILLLVWRLGWLKASGITRLGRWQVWLIAFGGMIYFASVSLYSFYGKVAFDFPSLMRLPGSPTTIMTHFVVGLSEENLFRGLVLYSLVRIWRNTRRGTIESVVLTSLLFAVLHVTQVFTYGISLSTAVLLTLETFIIAIWWGALVLLGGSIWPTVMLHFVVNAVVAVQGLTDSYGRA